MYLRQKPLQLNLGLMNARWGAEANRNRLTRGEVGAEFFLWSRVGARVTFGLDKDIGLARGVLAYRHVVDFGGPWSFTVEPQMGYIFTKEPIGSPNLFGLSLGWQGLRVDTGLVQSHQGLGWMLGVGLELL